MPTDEELDQVNEELPDQGDIDKANQEAVDGVVSSLCEFYLNDTD